MSEQHSIAQKKRWSKVSPRVRSKKMSVLALKKQKSMSDKEKREHIRKMVNAKK